MRKGSSKSSRVNAEVRRELANIIHNEIKDPRIHPMTSVVSAEVTPDLKYCKVFVSVLADEEAKKETMEGLKKAAPYIRHELAVTVNLRNTPELKFILDDSIENGLYMSQLIEKVSAQDAAAIAARGDEEETEEQEDEFFDDDDDD